MIELHFSPTPNGLKVQLCLEELALPYRLLPISLSRGEQFSPAFTAMSPNQKIPVIVDQSPAAGTEPVTVFESGAILLYLARKTGRLMPVDPLAALEAEQWLFWQMSALGPMAGQAGYFRVYAPEPVPFAVARYTRELTRLYGVLDKRLAGREFIAGEAISITDIACFPWIVPHAAHGQDLASFPNLARWFAAIGARPTTRRTYDGVMDVYATSGPPVASQRRLHATAL
ncbi:MAG: glutathione binding-like protein [Thermomonas sp.]